MKKIVSLLLVLVMMLGLVACGASKPAETTAAPVVETEAAPVETEAAETEAALVVDTCILMEADNDMLNTYSVIAVNPEAPFVDADGNAVSDVAINTAGATALYQWLVSQEALDMAGAYGVAAAASVKDAFAAIAAGEHTFVSRGDASGTHTKEISLWPEDLAITAEADSFAAYTEWYVSANTGMGACLVMAEEMGAYILTDKATFLTFVATDGVM